MYKRLENWMKLKGLKPSKLADNIKVNRATISHILSGRNKPSIDFIQKLLLSYPDLDANWLITGIGYMNKNQKIDKNKSDKTVQKVVLFYDDSSFQEIKS